MHICGTYKLRARLRAKKNSARKIFWSLHKYYRVQIHVDMCMFLDYILVVFLVALLLRQGNCRKNRKDKRLNFPTKLENWLSFENVRCTFKIRPAHLKLNNPNFTQTSMHTLWSSHISLVLLLIVCFYFLIIVKSYAYIGLFMNYEVQK